MKYYKYTKRKPVLWVWIQVRLNATETGESVEKLYVLTVCTLT